MRGESSSNIYQKKFQRSTTSLVRTAKPQTFKLVFLKNVILQLLLFKNSRHNLLGQFQSPYCQHRSSQTALVRVHNDIVQSVQRWKPVGLPVGSRFFNQSVKLVETPVKFSFLAIKRRLSTSRNTHIYFIVNKSVYKKTVLTNHTF